MQGGECERSAAALAYCFVCVGFFCFFLFFLLLKDRKEERRKERIKRN